MNDKPVRQPSPGVSTLLQRFSMLVPQAEIKETCPYFEDRQATFRCCDGMLAAPMYRDLLDHGYRRSGYVMYRPICQGCSECKILRAPVATFKKSKAQRRIWNRLADRIEVRTQRPRASREKLRLYRDYLLYQHGSTDGAATPTSYKAFLMDSCLGGDTLEMEYYLDDTLVGVGIVDRLEDALSSVYFYFHPDYAGYSLGTWSVLYEIESARRWNYTYYYLGYYIADCTAMNYKRRFRPCEIKDPDDASWSHHPR